MAQNATIVVPNIRVVNMSLGRPRASNPVDDVPIHNAVTALFNAGISVVVSAGNDPNFEANDNVPARFGEVMAIASTTAEDGNNAKCGRNRVQVKADTASYFTTDGSTITMSAPGASHENILKGCFLSAEGILSLNLGGGTTRKFGTSMAAPHVAGVLALMLEVGILSPDDARARLQDGAERVGDAPAHSPSGAYTFDGVKEGILSAPGALASTATAP